MPLWQGFCSSKQNLCRCGKVSVNVFRTYAVVARVLFKLISYDAVVLWKYLRVNLKRSEADTVFFLIHAGERRRRRKSAFTIHPIMYYIGRLRRFHPCKDAQTVSFSPYRGFC